MAHLIYGTNVAKRKEFCKQMIKYCGEAINNLQLEIEAQQEQIHNIQLQMHDYELELKQMEEEENE